MKYKCVTKCFHMNRKWEVGEVVEFDRVPPRHFQPVAVAVAPTVVVNKVIVDPMKPDVPQAVSALSQFSTQPKMQGFASSITPTEPVQAFKPKGRVGRPRKE